MGRNFSRAFKAFPGPCILLLYFFTRWLAAHIQRPSQPPQYIMSPRSGSAGADLPHSLLYLQQQHAVGAREHCMKERLSASPDQVVHAQPSLRASAVAATGHLPPTRNALWPCFPGQHWSAFPSTSPVALSLFLCVSSSPSSPWKAQGPFLGLLSTTLAPTETPSCSLF